ncbi:putative nucleic acid-binding protein [Caldanaerobacter subterraneus subsp. tengcongensis MB4]|uniref:Uncharacterized protein n=2 Tax=Caldanaerobacter subterraneus TaxID=911092 RepID=Q8RAZ9_CALS4|nr:hypothetical protein TTE1029 [Caldanaerobacter subterraneus subsp. tengcongensis MB4]MCS3916187.1 putative nucleic acid-binding protein [Caldanaerobacter subterraneus subsp. tengcongensis MB4]TCO63846.1 hypothetical protein EV203_1131 [Caldanaerobacter subterraneus]
MSCELRLFLCLKRKRNTFLLAIFSVCKGTIKNLELTVVSTLGVLIKAKEKGILKK